jgi:hypothetical protein
MVDPSQHADSRNWLESLLRKIPGFKGYLEKEYRRESDELARTLIADHLKKCKSLLDDVQRSLVDAGRIDDLPYCERVRSRLDLTQSRVQGAMRGYSGFFDFVRVDETVLDQVYQHDLSLIQLVQQVVSQVQQLASSGRPLRDSLSEVLQQLDRLGSQLDERTKLLEGISSA